MVNIEEVPKKKKKEKDSTNQRYIKEDIFPNNDELIKSLWRMDNKDTNNVDDALG